MNSFSFGKEIYGIRWGKYCDGVLNILYEQNNLFDLPTLKQKIENEYSRVSRNNRNKNHRNKENTLKLKNIELRFCNVND